MEVCRSCTPSMVNIAFVFSYDIPPFQHGSSGLAGGKDLEEIELLHLDGHKGSKPVRIGNGAADHIQLVYLYVFRLLFLVSITWTSRIFTASCASASG